jgi:RTX calcium-binding nonapeptide repeat (4 copies)
VERKLWPAAALVVLGCLPATADAFIGPYTGLGRGSLEVRRHIDNQASDPADRIVTDSLDVYRARFRYSFRIDGFGRINGIGNGSYQTATYHLEGTNGDQGSFSCDLDMSTTDFALRVTGQAADGRMTVRFALDGAREANDEVLCGAGYSVFATDDTRLARSLELVQPPEGIVIDQTDPSIAPMIKTVAEGDATDSRTSDHAWRFTIEPPPPEPPNHPENAVGAYDTPRQAGRRARICTIESTGRNDILNGTRGNDVICAYGGRDVVNGGGGHDLIYGGPGRDRITGGRGLDTLYGNGGRDRLNARDRRLDVVNGGDGNDRARVDGRDRVREVELVG